MLEVEQASLNTEAQSRLTELRSQLGLPSPSEPPGLTAATTPEGTTAETT